MNWPRFLRAALCLLVVCCLIFNIVSIPTKALAIVDDIALGIFALIALASAGMVMYRSQMTRLAQLVRTSKALCTNGAHLLKSSMKLKLIYTILFFDRKIFV